MKTFDMRNLGTKGAYLKQAMQDKLIEHKNYIDNNGEDLRSSATGDGSHE
jgi:phosphoketolase